MIIYMAINKINDSKYIGQTIKSLEERKRKHFYDAFSRKKTYYFHRALRKYGKENFEWIILEECSILVELNEKEIYYIDFYNTFLGEGYNLTKGGRGALGWKHTEEAKKKISEAGRKRKGFKVSESTKRKLSKFRKDKKYNEIFDEEKSEEIRNKQSSSHKLRYETIEGKKRITELSRPYEEIYGKEKSAQIKEKMSKSNKGKLDENGKRTDWTLGSSKKLSESQMGSNNSNYTSMSFEEIERLKNIYVDNSFVLNKEICNDFEYSRYVLTRVLKEEKLWKKGK